MDRDRTAPTVLIPTEFAERVRTYHSGGAQWLQELPGLIERCAGRWGLDVGHPFEPGGDTSWVAPVGRRGGTAVLRIAVPLAVHDDDVVALRAWDGRGAVRVFEHDPEIRATLMELCTPGTDATDLTPAEADEVAAAVLPQLWSAEVPELTRLQVNAAERAQVMDWRGSGVRRGPVPHARCARARRPAACRRACEATPDRAGADPRVVVRTHGSDGVLVPGERGSDNLARARGSSRWSCRIAVAVFVGGVREGGTDAVLDFGA